MSKRAVGLLLLLAVLVAVGWDILTSPLTPTLTPTPVPAPAPVTDFSPSRGRAGWWCPGEWERLNAYIEICVTTNR
ncbi:MAG: hypothetical protein RML46_12535 [Anaerolineae bacterium]|nr:hypothetical protein [Anaerolineae bacterium]